MDENFRLDFNSDRKVLNLLVFAYGTFNRGCSFDVMTYDLVLTCERYALNCCMHLQGAEVSQTAENCFCYLFSPVLHLHYFEQYSVRFAFPVKMYSL